MRSHVLNNETLNAIALLLFVIYITINIYYLINSRMN